MKCAVKIIYSTCSFTCYVTVVLKSFQNDYSKPFFSGNIPDHEGLKVEACKLI